MNKNTVGFILSIAALFAAYYAANVYLLSPAPTDNQGERNQLTAATPTKPEESEQTPVTPTPTPAAAVAETEGNSEDSDSAGESPADTIAPMAKKDSFAEPGPDSVTLENENLLVRFSAQGGCLSEANLKNYTTEAADQGETVQLIEKLETCKALGFKLGTLDLREVPAKLTQLSPTSLAIEQRASGFHIKRVFSLSDAAYQGEWTLSITNSLDTPASQLLEFEIGATSSHKDAAGFLSFDQSGMKKASYFAADDIEEEVLSFESAPSSEVILLEPRLNLEWAATGSTYFHFVVAPNFRETVGFRVERQPFNMQRNRQSEPERTIYEAWVQHNIQLNAQQSRDYSYLVYLGPKKLDLLKGAAHRLDESINFGFFRIIAWPMFKVLGFLESLTGNWGVAIIILTFIIRLLFLPLTAKSYTASKKMQKLQPKLNELREKYKDDKQTQQKELMSLMSKEGVNPLGGCLPILPQIPVFFGLNAVLMNTFDLRQAPFALWIQDLSTSDPLYITPVLMALLMYLQQKMIPMPSMDPNQAKMMRLLPLIFAVFMISYPSGLVLYIITSTVFSMVQQQIMMRRYKDA